jgi:hypothetical protein
VNGPSVLERLCRQRGTNDPLRAIIAYAELVRKRRPCPAGSQDQRFRRIAAEVVVRQELLQGEPYGHRILSTAQQPISALGDAGDFTECGRQLVEGIEEIGGGGTEGNLVRGNQRTPVPRIIPDGRHDLAIHLCRGVQRQIAADQPTCGEAEGLRPLREYRHDR